MLPQAAQHLPHPGCNLYDFDPASDSLPINQLDVLDRYVLARFAAATKRILNAYGSYEFATATQTLSMLATIDLSAFYVDVTKDRMYTLGARSRDRRSTQTAMYALCDGLARLLAPILPVTADDLWRYMPGKTIGVNPPRRVPERRSPAGAGAHGRLGSAAAGCAIR
jgi:isoleucyl-tRNA synthetase